MTREPEIALAASPRDWAQRLHRHLADHGGARVRATVLHPHDALAETYDVLVVDDTTSFLSSGLLDELRRTGRRVLGVYDPDDPHGKGELVQLGVDLALPGSAATAEFLDAVTTLAADAQPQAPLTGDPAPAAPPGEAPRGHITVVGGPPGGCGATEVAVAMAATVGGRGQACVLVDADEVAPSLAQRLGLPTYPNLRVAVDAVGQAADALGATLTAVDAGGFWALPGQGRAGDWPHTRPADVVAVAQALARPGVHVLVDVAHRVEDPGGTGGPPRYAATRALLAAADTVVGVGVATPVGVARLLAWVAAVAPLTGHAPLHLVCNRAPTSSYKREEVAQELRRNVTATTLTFLPADRRVEAAGWACGLVAPGPFSRAVGEFSATAVPAFLPAPGGGRGTGRRGTGRRGSGRRGPTAAAS